MTARKPSRGARLEAEIKAEMKENGGEPTSTESETIRCARTLADRLDELQAVIDTEGLMITTSRGDSKINPAATEQRAITVALARTLATIKFAEPVTKIDARRQRAANRRWARDNPS